MNQKFLVAFGEGVGEDDFMIIKADMENLAAFLATYSSCPEIQVETLHEYPLLNTRYGIVDRCYDQDFMQEFLSFLLPYQIGDQEPGEIESIQLIEEVMGVLIPVPDWDCANGHGIFDLNIEKPGEMTIVPDQSDLDLADLDEGEELEP